MAIWKDSSAPQKDATPPTTDAMPKNELDFLREPAPSATSVRRTQAPGNESVIGAELTFVGKIDGAGSVRIAGKFEGDVNIQGDLTIDAGAKLTGSVRAKAVAIAGEIEGNIESAARVELLATAVVAGDVKAGTLTVAAGSRMRGQVEFGWSENELANRSSLMLGNRQAS